MCEGRIRRKGCRRSRGAGREGFFGRGEKGGKKVEREESFLVIRGEKIEREHSYH